jgi:hypothetical protein
VDKLHKLVHKVDNNQVHNLVNNLVNNLDNKVDNNLVNKVDNNLVNNQDNNQDNNLVNNPVDNLKKNHNSSTDVLNLLKKSKLLKTSVVLLKVLNSPCLLKCVCVLMTI